MELCKGVSDFQHCVKTHIYLRRLSVFTVLIICKLRTEAAASQPVSLMCEDKWKAIRAECIKTEPWMEEDLLNEISLLMSILKHIRLSGQHVHSRDTVSIVTYANLVLLSEMHESYAIIVMNHRTLSFGVRPLITSVWL